MCDSNGDSAKVTSEGRSIDEGFCHLMGAMYNDMPSELNSQTKRNPEMIRSIRSIRLPRPTAFAARYVTKVLHPSPMIVSKRFVKPQMMGDNNGQGSDQDRLLRKLFCVPLLSKIVLLITPRGSNSHMNDMFNIHAYMIEDQFHLGVTSLTASERELFVNPQKPNNYALICCSGHIHLEDAFMNASLKKNIIQMSKNKSNAVVEIKCKGKRLSLQYTGDPHQPKIEATGSGKSRQVKIPALNATADIYPLQLKNISTNRQINAATSEVPLEIFDNQIEELSEANANSVEQQQPLAQIVHQNIQQNIDNFEQIVEQQPATETEPHIMDNEKLSAEQLSNKVGQVPQEDKENINASIEKVEEPIIQQNNKNIKQIMETSDQHLNKAEKVPKEILNSEIEELSESNANCVEQPQPLAQIVHQNIQQNIDNAEQIMELAEQQPSTETPVYQRSISSCSQYSYRGRRPSRIFSKSQPDKMLSSGGTLDVRVKQKSKSLVTETRKPQWVTAGLNSKHRNYVVIYNPKEIRGPTPVYQRSISSCSQHSQPAHSPPEPCEVENIQKITDSRQIVESLEQHLNELEPREEMHNYKHTRKQSNDVSELLQDELKDIKDVPIEDVREVKEVEKQVIFYVKKPATPNFNKEYKDKLKQFQIDRRLKKSLQSQQAANETSQSSLFKEPQLNNRPQILGHTPVYQRSISSCSQYSYRGRRQSRIFSKSQPDKTLSSGGTLDVRVKQKRSSCKSLVTETRKPQWVTAGLNSKHRNYVVIYNPKEIRGPTPVYQRSITSCSQHSQPAHSPPEPCEVENIQKLTDSRQIVESLEQHLNELEPREEMHNYKHTRKQSNDVSELLQDELKDIKDVPIEDVREVKEVEKQVIFYVKKPATPNFNKEYKKKLKQFQIDRRLKKSLQSQQAANETSQSSLFKEPQLNNRPQILGHTPVYQRSISSCSQYSYRGRRQSRIFSKSQPDKMLSSGGTLDVRVKQKRSSCKSLVTETRKPQWVTAGLNSKHRNYVVIYKPKEVITQKALEENYERDMSSAGDAMPSQNNMLVLYDQEDDDYDPNYCYELWPPQLLESESEGGIDESTIDCLIPNSQTILDANSTQFERMMQHPVAVPKTFSHRTRQLIEDKLSSVDAKQAFHNLGSLIRRVNSRPIPHDRHLQILFRLFARLDVQLFVRAEFNLPGCNPTPTMPRCRIECFFFPDRSDFIVSIAVLRSQLEQLMRQIPQILPNLHYCRDAFDLTRVPDVVRNYVRNHFNKLLKDLLAEYCYQLIQEKTPISAMPYELTDHDILGDDIFLRPKATKILPLTLEKLN
ncbi:uncharacterized protein LOC133847697 [Drosophila sulfurigaster albostrigata]|uniref:uncharacterized protein LOC133847697 n=1 Tax=Drosophila sulfurigaster albostrigata TaxID=89887 RepID=UPI002D21AD41|nr:uncharacterized protein LOC133847697 [Drosophila sulfurigaster albostrigata]